MQVRHLVWALIAFVVYVMGAGTMFIVYPTEQALVTQFKRPVAVYQDAGLHFKIPLIQTVEFYDKRMIEFNAEPKEVILSDQERLIVDAFVRYKITDPLRFAQTVGNEARMNDRLNAVLESSLRQVLGNAPLNDLLTSERFGIMKNIHEAVSRQASGTTKDTDGKQTNGFGIEVVDVRITRADLPPQNSQFVFENMKSEREKLAKNYRAKGEQDSLTIRSRAEKKRTILLAEAKKTAETLRGEGDAKASKIYADAYGRDPEFYEFYRSMQAYVSVLGSKDTTMVMSPSGEFLKFIGTR